MSSLLLRHTIPFANEFANLLTIAFPKLFQIYKLYPTTANEALAKALIDAVALFGISWNSIYVALQHKTLYAGLVKATVLLVLAFVVPNLYMSAMVEAGTKLVERDTPATKLTLGILVVLVLVVLENGVIKWLL
tara:strand:- start:97 stop:498 length:402 start_codon:yes stop_codon:yes gene_type:complete